MVRGPEGHDGEPGDPHADLAANHDPVDVSAVRRDDALIDAIVSGDPVTTEHPDEYQVAALLANWRTEIVAQPMPAEPDLDDIVARVNRELEARELDGRQSEGRRSLVTGFRSGRAGLRLLRPIAAAAAVVAIAMGGMTVFSYNAEPGDPLWSVKQVVFTQQAASTVAKIDTTSNLQEAERLIATGDTTAARARLDSAAARASAVNDAGTRNELNGWRQRLLTQLQTTPPATPPPETTPSTVDQPSGTPAPESSTPSASVPSSTGNSEPPSTVPSTSPAESSTPQPSTSPSPTSTSGPSQPSTSSPTPTSTPSPTSTTKATGGELTGGTPTGGGSGSLDPSTR